MSAQPDHDHDPPVALVTGATSGIGRAVALKLAMDGFYVIAHGRDASRGRATVEEIKSNGGPGRSISADLSAPADVERLAGEAGDGGRTAVQSRDPAKGQQTMEGIHGRPPMITAARGWVTGRLNLPPNGAMLLLASIIVSFLAASSAPTPLYALYQTRWGFSAITTTVIFGVYALAVLSALLTLGRISDHIGRRPVLLGAIAVQAMAMVHFATADSIAALLVARIVQGLSTGAAVAAVGAAMLDIDRRQGAVANSVAPGIGTAIGAMASALVVHYLPAPTHLVYLVLLGLFALQAIGVLAIPETAKPEPGVLASMIPEVTLPRRVARSFAVAAPVLFAVWALAGFYGSLGPALIATLVHSRSSVFAGVGLFILAGVAAASVMLLRNKASRTIMLAGVLALIVGVSVTLVSTSLASPAGFFTGTAIAGAGFGSGFQGGIRLVLPLAQAHERAGVLSLLYVVSYLGLGLPAVVGGLLVVESGDLLLTAREYGIAVIVLAAVALVGLVLPESQPMQDAASKPRPQEREHVWSGRQTGRLQLNNGCQEH